MWRGDGATIPRIRSTSHLRIRRGPGRSEGKAVGHWGGWRAGGGAGNAEGPWSRVGRGPGGAPGPGRKAGRAGGEWGRCARAWGEQGARGGRGERGTEGVGGGGRQGLRRWGRQGLRGGSAWRVGGDFMAALWSRGATSGNTGAARWATRRFGAVTSGFPQLAPPRSALALAHPIG